jgi:hypothetical protein
MSSPVICLLVIAACAIVFLLVWVCVLTQERDAFRAAEQFQFESARSWREHWAESDKDRFSALCERDRLAELFEEEARAHLATQTLLGDEIERQHELRDEEQDRADGLVGVCSWWEAVAKANAKNAEKAAAKAQMEIDATRTDRDFWRDFATESHEDMTLVRELTQRAASMTARELRAAVERLRTEIS